MAVEQTIKHFSRQTICPIRTAHDTWIVPVSSVIDTRVVTYPLPTRVNIIQECVVMTAGIDYCPDSVESNNMANVFGQ